MASERGRRERERWPKQYCRRQILKGWENPAVIQFYIFIYIKALRIILGTSEHLINGS